MKIELNVISIDVNDRVTFYCVVFAVLLAVFHFVVMSSTNHVLGLVLALS